MRQLFLATSVMGVVMAVGLMLGGLPGGAAYDVLFGLVFLDPPAATGDGARLLGGVAGGVWAGWSVMLILLVRDPELARSPALWEAAAVGLATWFTVDSFASVWVGAAPNVLGNLVYLAGSFVPALVLRARLQRSTDPVPA